jgi:hypothetical protein
MRGTLRDDDSIPSFKRRFTISRAHVVGPPFFKAVLFGAMLVRTVLIGPMLVGAVLIRTVFFRAMFVRAAVVRAMHVRMMFFGVAFFGAPVPACLCKLLYARLLHISRPGLTASGVALVDARRIRRILVQRDKNA